MKSSKSSAKYTTQELCPCESKTPYSICCEAYHQGLAAPTAEVLMRSRYTAYVLGLENYLLKTWHPDTCPISLNLAEEPTTKWLGLQIKHVGNTGEGTATVEFVARYKIASTAERLHEISQFVCLEGCWYYLTGTYPR